ncbi:uncharacterized protein PG986_014541 [Apiospora aurea]|uniref:Uncharacterized protein n=1 Tax=Apiospora aurea TaxID=335848 RepID=A0ABR1PTL4_9PEZI
MRTPPAGVHARSQARWNQANFSAEAFMPDDTDYDGRGRLRIPNAIPSCSVDPASPKTYFSSTIVLNNKLRARGSERSGRIGHGIEDDVDISSHPEILR